MYRALQVNTAKNIPIRTAGEAMTRGMAVTRNLTTGLLMKATATKGISLLDVAPNSDGINAVVTPDDKAFENVAVNQLVLQVPTYSEEAFATTECATGLTVGALVKAVAGRFVAAAANDECDMVYAGPYTDPTGLTMYKIEKLSDVRKQA